MANNDFKNSLKYPRTYTIAEQQDISDRIWPLLDIYQKNNSFENREFMCYLSSAIFLTCKKLYPQLSIYIPFRIKSDISYMKNILKEFSKYALNIESKDPFDIFPIEKDISGLRIVLDNINFSLPSTPESEALFNDPEIKKLVGGNDENKNEYSRHKNFDFINRVEDYIQSPIKSGKQYFEFKKELLERIIKITPPQFTDERKPEPSFIQLYDKTIDQYNDFMENDSFPTNISDSEISIFKDLLNDFRSRIDDQLHFTILRKILPIVFDSPLVKNVLLTSYEWNKETLKPNAFQADYYTLNTPFGPVEVLSQSNKAHYASTKGSAYHSGMDNKMIHVKDFFELVDSNDEKDISYYLDILDSFSADSLISPYEIPEFKTEQEQKDFLSSPKGVAYLKSEKYREMMNHIKIKEKIQLLPQYLPEEVYDSNKKIDSKKLQELIDCGKIHPTIVDTNKYLFSTALSFSPYMNVCSSGHTSFTDAEIHHKKVIGEFAEVLRKKDSNTCLRDILIRRLENIIENPSNFNVDFGASLEIVKRHDEMTIKLPKNISPKNILSYGENLRKNMKKSDSDLDISK